MLEFLQSYGLWIFVGLLFSLMLWGHTRGHGIGCCGGHQYEHEAVKKDEQAVHHSRGRH
jgi:hypothetical protein